MARLANILLDESGRIRSWNPCARGLWGFDVEGASEVRVALAREGDVLLVRVADNGAGLRPAARGRKSYGLLGIRERAQTLGGEARIYSPAEGGTVVEIRIPLARFTGAEAAA